MCSPSGYPADQPPKFSVINVTLPLLHPSLTLISLSGVQKALEQLY
uniref:Uncharacterized protein n=1 Tax=Anguilla anguilla TaxID=7936 RepID=A0A0E9UUV8_ANGAN